MIKKKVTKNVVLSAAELEYLANALKEEILILRGQVVKAGSKYTHTKDKKILSFIKNEELKMEGAEQTAETEENSESEEKPNDNDKPLEVGLSTRETPIGIGGYSCTRGNLAVRRRHSILHVDEETLIMKYCELKAKFENLEQAARNRIINESHKDAEAREIINECRRNTASKIMEIEEKKLEEVEKAHDNLDKIKEVYLHEKNELEKKCSILELENLNNQDELDTCKKELEGIKQIMDLIESDNKMIQDKLENKKNKNKQLKEKVKEFTEEKAGRKDEIDKLSNEINDLKIKEIDQSKEIERLKAENIALSKIISEAEKQKILTDKIEVILEENANLKKEILSYQNKENKINEEMNELNKKVKEYENEIKNHVRILKERDDRIHDILSANEAKEIRENNEKLAAETK
jgi:chromosome segregation ATPase